MPRLIRHAPVTPCHAESNCLRKPPTASCVTRMNWLRVLAKREQYDVVLCGHINLLPFAEIARRLLRAKHVF